MLLLLPVWAWLVSVLVVVISNIVIRTAPPPTCRTRPHRQRPLKQSNAKRRANACATTTVLHTTLAGLRVARCPKANTDRTRKVPPNTTVAMNRLRVAGTERALRVLAMSSSTLTGARFHPSTFFVIIRQERGLTSAATTLYLDPRHRGMSGN